MGSVFPRWLRGMTPGSGDASSIDMSDDAAFARVGGARSCCWMVDSSFWWVSAQNGSGS